MELLSVIVPVYNVRAELPKCIESILRQTYRNLELLLIDDGSDDGSEHICDDYAERDKRVKVIHQKNQGVSAARNIGLRMSNGTYIGFVDSDDWIAEDMYEVLIKRMIATQVDIGICGMAKVFNDGLVIMKKTQSESLMSRTKAMESLLRETFTGALCNKLYKADILHQIFLAEDILSLEDYLFNVWVFSKSLCEKVLYISDAKYFYRQRVGSSTHTLALKYTLSYLRVFPRIRRIIFSQYPQLKKVYWEIYKKYLVHGLVDFLQLNNEIGQYFFKKYRRLLFKAIAIKFSFKDVLYLLFFNCTYRVAYWILKLLGLEKHNSTNWIKKAMKHSYQ